MSAKTYDENTIQTLEALEHIRLRSGMYIGRLGGGEHYEDGIYILLKEIIDNSIDEYIMGNGERIEISIEAAGKTALEVPDERKRDTEPEQSPKMAEFGLVSVRDYGRGIPLGKLVEAVSLINTGAKYNDDVFQFSVGLNGVGTKAVNALSQHFLVRSFRGGQMAEAVFAQGKLQRRSQCESAQPNGTYVEFWPDSEIFGRFAFQQEFVQNRVFHYACLNPGLELALAYNGDAAHYRSRNGLQDLLEKELPSGTLYPIMRCGGGMRCGGPQELGPGGTEANREEGKLQGKLEEGTAPAQNAQFTERASEITAETTTQINMGLEFAFTHTQQIGESHFSFVNGQFTVDGGVHLQAFREGFTRGINDFYKTSYTAQDIRDGLVAAIKIRVKNPIFESQTKNKLGNTELRGPVAATVRRMTANLLYRNRELAEKLSEKIRQNEKLRKELSSVRKMLRESNKRLALNIPQLRDCKYHRGDRPTKKRRNEQPKIENKPSMIFLTEGQSATGSLVSCRDVYTQALFSLRGKPWNCFGRSSTEIYQNEELFHLLKALGLENGTEQLRYDQIILATDADD